MKINPKLQELENKWKRALADYQNLEKRIAAAQTDFVKFANADLIAKLLPILDDLEQAEAHLKDQGLSLILTRLRQLLTSENLAEIPSLNQPFNPKTMEAIETVPGKANTVIKVLTKGYSLSGKVIRPARVQVGKGGK